MPSGQSAGFARGLAGVLQSRTADRRKQESEQADRDFSVNLAMFQTALEQNIETGDYTASERMFELLNPEQAKQLKKQGGIGAVIGPIVQQAGLQEEGQDASQAEGAAEVEVPGQAGQVGPADAAAAPLPTGAQPPPPAAAVSPEFLGMPFGLSPEARIEQEATGTARTAEAGIQGKIAAARRMVQTGAAANMAEALDRVGLSQPRTGTQASGDFTLGTGQQRYDAEGNLLAEGRERAPGTTGGFTLGPDQVRYDPGGEEVARGPVKAADAAKAVDPTVAASARLAARQPQILQGWTPSDRREVLAVIEQDPELYLQYEGKRQEPARAMATTLQRSLDALLDTSGATPQLSRGAQMIFGLSKSELGQQAARFFTAEGKEAAASIKQIVGQEVLDEIAGMKAQSLTGATGFGQLNIAELDLLIASATVLQNWGLTTNNIGEARALTELIAIQDHLARIREDSDVEIEQQQLLDAQQQRDVAGATGIIIGDDGSIYQDGVLTILPDGSLAPPQ